MIFYGYLKPSFVHKCEILSQNLSGIAEKRGGSLRHSYAYLYGLYKGSPPYNITPQQSQCSKSPQGTFKHRVVVPTACVESELSHLSLYLLFQRSSL